MDLDLHVRCIENTAVVGRTLFVHRWTYGVEKKTRELQLRSLWHLNLLHSLDRTSSATSVEVSVVDWASVEFLDCLFRIEA